MPKPLRQVIKPTPTKRDALTSLADETRRNGVLGGDRASCTASETRVHRPPVNTAHPLLHPLPVGTTIRIKVFLAVRLYVDRVADIMGRLPVRLGYDGIG